MKVYRNDRGDWIVKSPNSFGTPYTRYNFAGFVDAPTEGQTLGPDTWALIHDVDQLVADTHQNAFREGVESACRLHGLPMPDWDRLCNDPGGQRPVVAGLTNQPTHDVDPHGTSGPLGRSGGLT